MQYDIKIYSKYGSKTPTYGVWLKFDDTKINLETVKYDNIVMVNGKPVLGASRNNIYTNTPDGHSFGGWYMYTLQGDTDGSSVSRMTIERYALEHYLERY